MARKLRLDDDFVREFIPWAIRTLTCVWFLIVATR